MTDLRHAQAMQARAEGQHDRAITLWRQILRDHPDDWRLALELKRDLKAALHYPESDAQFRRAARFLPDAEWLAHYGALYAFHRDDLDAIDRRARSILAQRGDEPSLHAIIGDVAAQRRDWVVAEAAFARAEALRPNPELRRKRDTAAMYRRIAPRLAEPRPGSTDPSYAVTFINLDRNPEREAELRREFAGSAPALIRQPGVEGRRLAASAVRRLGADPHMRGTLGCFVSHAAAWEAFLDRGDEVGLFVEDDIVTNLDLPASFAPLNLPARFDLVFVNDRIVAGLDPASCTDFAAIPLHETMASFPPEDNAPGGDGYLLSRAGAQKLLTWLAEDGWSEDVDWRLIAYGLTEPQLAALPRPSHAAPWLERISQVIGRSDRLEAFALFPPLVRTVGVSSDREDENRLHASP